MGAYEFQKSGIMYVDDSNTGDEDGLSWDTAYSELSVALSQAALDDSVCEIRVAEGTYVPNDCDDPCEQVECP